jgi:hypothetical protein
MEIVEDIIIISKIQITKLYQAVVTSGVATTSPLIGPDITGPEGHVDFASSC